jgi:hypothetical protein
MFYFVNIFNEIRLYSRRMGEAGHVARMGRRGIPIGIWWEIEKE